MGSWWDLPERRQAGTAQRDRRDGLGHGEQDEVEGLGKEWKPRSRGDVSCRASGDDDPTAAGTLPVRGSPRSKRSEKGPENSPEVDRPAVGPIGFKAAVARVMSGVRGPSG
jgi:hypothetical protein